MHGKQDRDGQRCDSRRGCGIKGNVVKAFREVTFNKQVLEVMAKWHTKKVDGNLFARQMWVEQIWGKSKKLVFVYQLRDFDSGICL